MVVTKKTSGLHEIIDKNNNTYKLYIVTDYQIGGESIIINNESATGDGGVTYHNGRVQETIPINGELIGESIDDVNQMKENLLRLKDLGEVIEFVGPYKFINRTNKYFIKDVKFSIVGGNDKTMPFSMTLVEYRNANVEKITINEVNFELGQRYLKIYNERIGNL